MAVLLLPSLNDFYLLLQRFLELPILVRTLALFQRKEQGSDFLFGFGGDWEVRFVDDLKQNLQDC